MRYLVRLVCVLAGLVALPLSVSAQASDKERLEDFYPGTLPESPQEFDKEALDDFYPESARPSEPTPEEPALQLTLDDAGVEVAPIPPRTVDGYTLEEMELRVRGWRIGLISSASLLAVGTLVMGSTAWAPADCPPQDLCIVSQSAFNRVVAGGVVMTIGAIGMIISGVRLSRRKRDRDWLKEAHYGTPRRVRWDLAQSRLVF